jgi:hypothetical protein
MDVDATAAPSTTQWHDDVHMEDGGGSGPSSPEDSDGSVSSLEESSSSEPEADSSDSEYSDVFT